MATARENLDRQVGEDNAGAIEAFIDEKLQQRSEDFEGLRQELIALREQVGDIPELRRQLSAAGQLLREAIEEHNGLVDRRNAGEPVSEREVVEGGARIERVSTEVGGVRDTLEERVAALEERADDPVTGFQALHDRDDNLQEQIDEIRDAQSQEAVVSGGKSGLAAALVTFVVVFILVSVWALVFNHSWVWAFAWGAVLGGLVGVIVGLAPREGTRTNTFIGDLRDTRRARQERQVHVADERPYPRVADERRERVDA